VKTKGRTWSILSFCAGTLTLLITIAFWSDTRQLELWAELNLYISFAQLSLFRVVGGLVGLFISASGVTFAIIGFTGRAKYLFASIPGIVLSVFSGLVLFFGWISLTGTPSSYGYVGEHIDLSTEVKNSILGAEYGWESEIYVIDEDSLGRRMFVFLGTASTVSGGPYETYGRLLGILIVQYSDKEYVYYYPDNNFLLFKYEDWFSEYPRYPNTEALLKEFADNPDIADEVERLKVLNDWEKPLNASKLTRVTLSRWDKDKDTKDGLVSEQSMLWVFDQIVEKSGLTEVGNSRNYISNSFHYLTSDDYGRHIYYLDLRRSSEYIEDHEPLASYVIMFNADGSVDLVYGVMELKDLWNYQDELRAFKKQNNWGQPS